MKAALFPTLLAVVGGNWRQYCGSGGTLGVPCSCSVWQVCKPKSRIQDLVRLNHVGQPYLVALYLTELDIVSLAGAIRVVENLEGQWLPLVRQLMVPLKYMMSTPTAIQQLSLSYNVPKGMWEAVETRIYTFSNVAALDAVFASVETNVWKLLQQAEEWNTPSK
ncbi:hypothetical protein R3P38DRAFT_3461579 [Favolaschia claudopus]|uniref:Uncharacterized protein n=1 Tax=Favolaschia claudopus TaxID=2862362 RepID=A0AAW0CPD5_9AGAR